MKTDHGQMPVTQVERLRRIANNIVSIVEKKNPAYGGSWMSHGGFSAFFNLDRKWSRILTASKSQNYDVFKAIQKHPDTIDALMDLIAYALLILENQTGEEAMKDG